MVRREKKPSEFDKWSDYVAEKMRKYYWKDKTEVVFGEFPKICPLAVPERFDNLYPGPKSGMGDGVVTINGKMYGECKCTLYEQNKDTGCECWYKYPPSKGRCDCFMVYWNCSMFRKWLKIKEIGVVVK